MSELVLIAAVGALGLVAAGILARWVLAHEGGGGAMKDASDAFSAAATALQTRQAKTTGAACAVLAVLLFASLGFVPSRTISGVGGRRIGLAIWSVGSFGVGAASALCSGFARRWVSVRATERIAASRASGQSLLELALRSGAIPGLVAEATALLGMIAVLAAIALIGPSYGTMTGDDLAAAPSTLACFALGTSAASLFVRLGGGILASAAESAAQTEVVETGLRNPAVIMRLIGRDACDSAGAGADMLDAGVATAIGALILVGSVQRANGELFSAAGPAALLGLLAFPLASRAFGILAAIVGVMSVTTDENEHASVALERGFIVTALLACLGSGGAAFWLLGRFWAPFFACGLIGIGASVAAVRAARVLEARARSASPPTGLSSTFAELRGAWIPVAIAAVAVVASSEVGAHSGLAHAGGFGAAIAACAMLMMGPYALAAKAVGTLPSSARSLAQLAAVSKPLRRDVADDGPSPRGTSALMHSFFVAASTFGVFVLLLAYGAEVDDTRARSSMPAAIVGAIAGAALSLAFASLAASAMGASAPRLAQEVRRQMATVPSLGGYSPNYRRCVNVLAKDSRWRVFASAGLIVVTIVTVGSVGRHALDAGGDAVGGFLIATSVSGIVVASMTARATPPGIAGALRVPFVAAGALALVLSPLFV